jgi:glycogen debranching enzyme
MTTLRQRAEEILRANDRGGTTLPSTRLYPHQWNWDSAFAAIGWAYVDPRRAARELETLMRGQWDDGLVPHILFSADAVNYEPGPKQWGTENVAGSPADVKTSSITQPPVAATAARRVLEISGGDAEVERSLRALVPKLERWHAWFATTRDPTGEGLCTIVHPWESGMDNAPRWDAAMRRIEPGQVEYKRVDDSIVDASQRPTRFDYDRYMFLVKERARLKFAPPKPDAVSFLVTDVAMASILCRAEEDLAWLAGMLGIETSGAQTRRGRLAAGLNGPCFDRARGRYRDVDVRAGEPLEVDHVAYFMPLYANVVPNEAVPAMVARLQDPAGYGAAWPVPTVPPSDPVFEARRYWRGPTWINVNWLLIEGLTRAGAADAAKKLAERTIELVERSGFYEYFDPLTGEGLGADGFAWTAALAIDLIARRR